MSFGFWDLVFNKDFGLEQGEQYFEHIILYLSLYVFGYMYILTWRTD